MLAALLYHFILFLSPGLNMPPFPDLPFSKNMKQIPFKFIMPVSLFSRLSTILEQIFNPNNFWTSESINHNALHVVGPQKYSKN